MTLEPFLLFVEENISLFFKFSALKVIGEKNFVPKISQSTVSTIFLLCGYVS